MQLRARHGGPHPDGKVVPGRGDLAHAFSGGVVFSFSPCCLSGMLNVVRTRTERLALIRMDSLGV